MWKCGFESKDFQPPFKLNPDFFFLFSIPLALPLKPSDSSNYLELSKLSIFRAVNCEKPSLLAASSPKMEEGWKRGMNCSLENFKKKSMEDWSV